MIPSLGRLYVQDLTPVRVQQYYGKLRRKSLANNTIRSTTCCCTRRSARR